MLELVHAFQERLEPVGSGWVAWNQSARWAYSHGGNQQMLQFRVFFFPFGRACCWPFTLTPLPLCWYHHRYLKRAVKLQVSSQRVPFSRPGWGRQFAFLVSSWWCWCCWSEDHTLGTSVQTQCGLIDSTAQKQTALKDRRHRRQEAIFKHWRARNISSLCVSKAE